MKLLEVASMKIGNSLMDCLSGITAVMNEKRRRILRLEETTINQSKMVQQVAN